jgi:hypothetical protein
LYQKIGANLTESWYAIQHKKTGQFLGITVSGNGEAEFCNSYNCYFTDCEPPHLFEKRTYAEEALTEDTKWYNTGLCCPGWRDPFDREDYKVVKISLKEEKS